MKKISFAIPCYNEENNINEAYSRIKYLFDHQLQNYLYEILFIDNNSMDNTKQLLTELAERDKNVKVIFNAKNFGWVRSSFHGLKNTTGDATIYMPADMQDPPEIIPQFVEAWESGHKIVMGIKNKSRENSLIFFLRTLCYKLINFLVDDIDHVENFGLFGLYDRDFIKIIKNLNEPQPYLKGIVAELGYKTKKIYFTQDKRSKGKSKFNFIRSYDIVMLGITSYSKICLRIAILLGFFFSIICFIIAAHTFIRKLINWDAYSVGVAAIVIGVFFIGSLQLFFIGLIGEYILSINKRLMNRPLVIEEKRINFNENE